ncbi:MULTISPECIES: flagellar biosynthetic protein FliO [Gilliamella]|uniref:Flagellar protein n=1 Tax=Gilliamella apis TaxID=1970738 RepID=A0A2V4DWL1_9GAMM|nr:MULTISPECIES: flagellar biosynthetic protein FliO [Gilliamella]MBI0006272.1 flagellar biosynthetic protein FliO [Gilliamella sp. W8126]MBI0038726.1 flagellar biosynthetic protein FliO [Gilliamella sp. B14384G10]MBI0041005.1 flagellar biosynthetic protein FliO [Gilliamella sp. B14384G7]MBI0052704.1 flagellar biosynthetic protein FliO [Gilliamella sp. B14384G13]MBI0055013.1 flagellar biosynthetic protein FliO [Gilliamella sp. B14384H2]
MSESTINSGIQNFSSIPAESSLYSQIGIAFFSVITIIFVLIWLIKRLGWQKSTKQFIDVKATYNINAKDRIMLVYVDHQLLVVGVTAQQMTLLHTINEQRTEMLFAEPADVEQQSKNNLFNQILRSVLNSKKV